MPARIDIKENETLTVDGRVIGVVVARGGKATLLVQRLEPPEAVEGAMAVLRQRKRKIDTERRGE